MVCTRIRHRRKAPEEATLDPATRRMGFLNDSSSIGNCKSSVGTIASSRSTITPCDKVQEQIFASTVGKQCKERVFYFIFIDSPQWQMRV